MFSQACVKNSVHTRPPCQAHPRHARPLQCTPLPLPHMPPTMHATRILRDAVNERAVRFLLECILLVYVILY